MSPPSSRRDVRAGSFSLSRVRDAGFIPSRDAHWWAEQLLVDKISKHQLASVRIAGISRGGSSEGRSPGVSRRPDSADAVLASPIPDLIITTEEEPRVSISERQSESQFQGPMSPPALRRPKPEFLPAYLSNGFLGLRVGTIPLTEGLAIVSGLRAVDPVYGIETFARGPYPLAGTSRSMGR